jgi:hypothetical protein
VAASGGGSGPGSMAGPTGARAPFEDEHRSAHEHAVTRPTPTKSLRRPTVALVSGVLNDKREER